MIKAAFFDVDCTLYSWEEHRFIPSGIEAIKKAKKQGLKVFLCSSRPYHSMKHFGCMDLGIAWDGWVGSGGAVACYKNKILHQEAVDPRVAKDFLRFAKTQGCMAQVVGPKSRYYSEEPNEYFDRFVETFSEPYAPAHPFRGGVVVGFLLFAPESFDQAFKDGCPELHFSRFHPYGVDVVPRPRSKGRGAKAILDHLGIAKEEAVGFGDDLADIDMLDGIGNLVAMGNGREEVKQAATFVTTDIAEDGIVNGLAHFGY